MDQLRLYLPLVLLRQRDQLDLQVQLIQSHLSHRSHQRVRLNQCHPLHLRDQLHPLVLLNQLNQSHRLHLANLEVLLHQCHL